MNGNHGQTNQLHDISWGALDHASCMCTHLLQLISCNSYYSVCLSHCLYVYTIHLAINQCPRTVCNHKVVHVQISNFTEQAYHCSPSSSNQSFYRQTTGYGMSVGDHRVAMEMNKLVIIGCIQPCSFFFFFFFLKLLYNSVHILDMQDVQ